MTQRETVALIALGANRPSEQGAPRETLKAALSLLEARGISVEKTSRWMTSPAWPAGSGPDYINGAARVSTVLSPKSLLDAMHKVEAILGRHRNGDRWAARTCDLDIIACRSMVSPDIATWRYFEAASAEASRENLIVPHPQMHRRAFVLLPLADVEPTWRHPVFGLTVTEMISDLPEEDCIAIAPLP